MSAPELIRIIEVGPRDGLQNESVSIPTDEKLKFIERLLDAGLSEIEVSSFVSPKWVPQLGDAEALWAELPEGGIYSALVPNLKGLERAIDLGVERIALFTAASETFTQKNINMTIAESIDIGAEVIRQFGASGGSYVRGYISMVIECPYEGKIAPEKVLDLCERLFDIGVSEVSLGETIGVASPAEVRTLMSVLEGKIPKHKTVWHFHDTRGTGIANMMAAVDAGYRAFDASAAGLGGCPYAKGAGGNISTEDAVYLAERLGFRTNVDLEALALASLPVLELLGRAPSSKAQLAMLPEA